MRTPAGLHHQAAKRPLASLWADGRPTLAAPGTLFSRLRSAPDPKPQVEFVQDFGVPRQPVGPRSLARRDSPTQRVWYFRRMLAKWEAHERARSCHKQRRSRFNSPPGSLKTRSLESVRIRRPDLEP